MHLDRVAHEGERCVEIPITLPRITSFKVCRSPGVCGKEVGTWTVDPQRKMRWRLALREQTARGGIPALLHSTPSPGPRTLRSNRSHLLYTRLTLPYCINSRPAVVDAYDQVRNETEWLSRDAGGDTDSRGARLKGQSFGSGGEEQNSSVSLFAPYSPRLSLGFVIRSARNSSNLAGRDRCSEVREKRTRVGGALKKLYGPARIIKKRFNLPEDANKSGCLVDQLEICKKCQ